ncbi:MAG: DUF4968 domain-containing protein, partial [candidate division KSB1 bacterium]|nr:DUF4968 domain-containing protein [candidate division KSB1 bacterium]
MKCKMFFTLLILMLFITIISANAAAPKAELIPLGTGDVLSVQVLTPEIFRIRLDKNGWFTLSSMEKYRIVRYDWPSTPVKKSEDGNRVIFAT